MRYDFAIIVDDNGNIMFRKETSMGKMAAKVREEIRAAEDAEIFRILDTLTSGNNDI